MKTIRKTIVSALMALLPITTMMSCKSTEPSEDDILGCDFTTIAIDMIEKDTCTIKFDYQGDNLQVDWGDETINSENSHTYENAYQKRFNITITGDITSITLVDKDGELLSADNYFVTSLMLSNTITSVPDYAFSGTWLNYVVIPNSVKKVGKRAFVNIESSIRIYCGAEKKPDGWDNEWTLFSSEVTWGASFYFKDNYGYILLHYNDSYIANLIACYDFENTELTVPNSVKVNNHEYKIIYVDEDAFYLAKQAEKINFGDSVIYLGPFACWGLENLKTVTFGDNSQLVSICAECFYGCTSLTDIIFPNSLQAIYSGAFYNCISLQNIAIPASTIWIVDGAFSVDSDVNPEHFTVDVSNYHSPDEIGLCFGHAFYDRKPADLKFIFDDKTTTVNDFVDRGWPTKGEATWTPKSSLSI